MVVYPDCDKGNYSVSNNNNKIDFSTGKILSLDFEDALKQKLIFERKDNILPTRIVTGLRIHSSKQTIPAECSLGVVHHKVPKKHFSWMVVSAKFDSTISSVNFEEVFGDYQENSELVFKLYSDKEKKPLERTTNMSILDKNSSIQLKELFPESDGFLENSMGWLTVWSAYSGIRFYSTLTKKNSITMEHAF